MAVVRFAEIELRYGCHSGRFVLQQEPRPIVIAGPNGSGKTTLIEALVRTIFGFHRRRGADSELLEVRRPWDGSPFRATVVLVDGEGERWTISREFESGRVEMLRPEAAGGRWCGDGNPGATNEEARDYRRQIQRLLGLSDLEAYASTLAVEQGELGETRLDENLLRTAAGGYGNVDQAWDRIQSCHRELTLRPITGAGRAAVKPRRLEKLDAQIEALEERLEHARRWETERLPLVHEMQRLAREEQRIREELACLEPADDALAARRALAAEVQRLADAVRDLERASRELGNASRELERAEREWEAIPAAARYPDDFPERASAARQIWRQQDRLESNRSQLEQPPLPAPASPLTAAASLALLAAAVVLYVLRETPLAAAALAASLLGGGLYLWRLRRGRGLRAEREARLGELEAQVRELKDQLASHLEGVPHAATLTPVTLPDRRASYDRQQRARRELQDARMALGAVIQRVSELLGEAAEKETHGQAAAALATMLEGRLHRARTELARKQLDREGAEAARLELPGGVAPEPAAVRRALEERRRERDRLSSEINEIRDRLTAHGSVEEAPVALAARLRLLGEERRDLLEKIEAHEAAYALLQDAYEGFRRGDQGRFVRQISDRLRSLTGERLGPLATPGALAETRLRVGPRALPFASPPLSHGEHQAALLAVRLGAADFLAAAGVVPPLIVDEPFAPIDLAHSRYLWELLRAIAQDRQVIVATQEELTLERLGVAPDITLDYAL